MKAADVLIAWGTEPKPWVKVSPMDGDHEDPEGQEHTARLLGTFVKLTAEVGIPADVVHEALLVIDEYSEAWETTKRRLSRRAKTPSSRCSRRRSRTKKT